jgi:putative acetyltransferase
MHPPVTIQRERPDHPQVVAALAALDDDLAALYPPQANHLLDVQALLAPQVRFFTARAGESLLGTAAVRLMPGEPATGGVAYGEAVRLYEAAGYARRGPFGGYPDNGLSLFLDKAL